MKNILIYIMMTFLISCFGATPEKIGLEGQRLPNLSILLRDSSTFNTSEISKEKPFIIFYFSPDCPHCKAQLAEITDHIDDLKSIPFYLVTNSSIQELNQFYKSYNLKNFPTLKVGKDLDNKILEYLGITAVPYTAIYGKDKKLDKVFKGKISSSQMKKIIKE